MNTTLCKIYMMQQQVSSYPNATLKQMHAIPGTVSKLADMLLCKEGGVRKERADIHNLRQNMHQCIGISPCGTISVKDEGWDFEAVYMLHNKTPVTYDKADKLYLAVMEAEVLPKKWFYNPSAETLGSVDDDTKRVYIHGSLENPRLYMSNCVPSLRIMAMDMTGRLMRHDTRRKDLMDQSFICLAVVRLGKPRVPRGEKPRSIVGAIIFDRRPILLNVTPESPMSTKAVYDQLAAGKTFDVCEMLYLLLCRVEGLEPSLCAYRMDVFVEELDKKKDQLPVTACFRQLMRELQVLYQGDPSVKTNTKECAKVLRRVLAPHANADVNRLVDQGPVDYEHIKMEFFHAQMVCYSDGTSEWST